MTRPSEQGLATMPSSVLTLSIPATCWTTVKRGQKPLASGCEATCGTKQDERDAGGSSSGSRAPEQWSEWDGAESQSLPGARSALASGAEVPAQRRERGDAGPSRHDEEDRSVVTSGPGADPAQT